MKNYLLQKNIVIATALLLSFVFLSQTASAQIGYTKKYKHGVVVSVNKIASIAGKHILQKGGNAVDAAVTVGFTLAVVNPRNGNLGGGGFMVIHLKDGTDKAINFREKAPHKSTTKMYIRNGKYQPSLSLHSPISSGVPGTVAGLVKAEKRYGDLSLKQVMAPAIQLARNGFRLTWLQAHTFNSHAKRFKQYESSAKYFTRKDGQPFQAGDLFVQKDLAQTLQRIASNGRDGFYSGKTAHLIAKQEKKVGGIIDQQDLKNYEAEWVKPVEVTFHGYHLHIMPAPSSGGEVVSQMLKMLKPYDLNKLGFHSAKYIQLLTEVMRRAYADRNYFLADPDFVEIPRKTLLSKSYLKKRMKNFSWKHATPSKKVSHGKINGYPKFSQSHTTNYCAVDKAGNAVDVTYTLNANYGNHLAIGGAGFLMNDEMDDFTSQPGKPNLFGLVQGKANRIKPGKRPLSSMSPTVVTKNGKVRMTLGAAGGSTIINTVLETFLDRAVFGMSAQQAISAPRFHNQWLPDSVYYEKHTINKDTRQKLNSRRYHLKTVSSLGVGNLIFVTPKGLREGGVDPRANGKAAGY
jgi:gamma-glutamyltranspeptidase/glutathione hydrolase